MICPRHGARFCLRTGEALTPPAYEPVRTYPTRITDGVVEVRQRMKRLILVRHAKSDWSLPDQQDWDRPLNKRGQRDAPEMARRLRAAPQAGPYPHQPGRAGRDHRNDHGARTAWLPSLLAPGGASVPGRPQPTCSRCCASLAASRGHVMVFGHNPGITEFANRLSADEHIDNMPTCAVFTAQFEIADWGRLDWGQGKDVEFDYPRKPPDATSRHSPSAVSSRARSPGSPRR